MLLVNTERGSAQVLEESAKPCSGGRNLHGPRIELRGGDWCIVFASEQEAEAVLRQALTTRNDSEESGA